MVVVSSAISADNPEIVAAHEARIPVIRRAEMLAELMRFRVASPLRNTRPTTTAMVSSIYASGARTTFVNGGLVKAAGGSCAFGAWSVPLPKQMRVMHRSCICNRWWIVTNIEADHMDTYRGDFENLKQTLLIFCTCRFTVVR